MNVIIAGGGTGGHLFPAVAVGEALLQFDPAIHVTYVGASNGLEARWLPAHHKPHYLLQVRGWTGKGIMTRLRAMREFVAASNRARALLDRLRPALVLGAGGYASAPVALAAILKRIPLVLMEQNTRPGLANRMLYRFARKICVGFDETACAFPASKVAVTGNPIRFTTSPAPPRLNGETVQILVLGGSSGAHRLNLGVLKAFELLTKNGINIDLTHQTGEADVEMVAEGYSRLGRRASVVAFIDDMARALASADLVIARAGAMTVSELALAGLPALLVPYPFHRDRQQELNARVLADRSAACIVPDDEHLGENLANLLHELAGDKAKREAMAARAKTAAKPHAAEAIARLCMGITRNEAAT
jgi:UDP-N-acetylglucosamine--N-acetylmuramyl-(pentapeptide) pyrophosphoryl-undecaprenol N-acetylglucosamine transferase